MGFSRALANGLLVWWATTGLAKATGEALQNPPGSVGNRDGPGDPLIGRTWFPFFIGLRSLVVSLNRACIATRGY